MDDIQSNLINFDNADVNPVFMSDVEKQVIRVSPITILKKQLVSDKKVVKCMKSLIGTYAHVCVVNKIFIVWRVHNLSNTFLF